MFRDQSILILFILSIFPLRGICQETTIFKVSDFDLKGKVKSCLVSTDYGKEEYTFNEAGFLTESATRFNDSDYDITIYKYGNGELLEKRVEQYRDKKLDRATSIANFYTIDTTGNRKVTEKIITYNKEFLEQNEYFYTIDDKLSKIIRTTNDGIDETSVIYSQKNAEETAEYFLNRELQQSVNTVVKIESDTLPIKTITIKKFFEGEPNTALKKKFTSDGKISSEARLSYDIETEKFLPSESTVHTYSPLGVVEKTIAKRGSYSETKGYVYQFDPMGNWVKQIVTPDNTYKTRKIVYYETPDSIKE